MMDHDGKDSGIGNIGKARNRKCAHMCLFLSHKCGSCVKTPKLDKGTIHKAVERGFAAKEASSGQLSMVDAVRRTKS